jgi:hypothetical protein
MTPRPFLQIKIDILLDQLDAIRNVLDGWLPVWHYESDLHLLVADAFVEGAGPTVARGISAVNSPRRRSAPPLRQL